MRDTTSEHSNPDQTNEPEASLHLDFPTFLRMFQMRKGQIMWFLGAGASRAAGIKTASDMIWEFKRNLYCSEKKQALSVVSDLGDPVVRRKLQSHFDSNGGYPSEGSEDEYAAYFEKTFPSPKDRRTYIDGEIKLGKPSFGHFGLALLFHKGLCRAVWTTNFDRALEDAAVKVMGSTGALVVADLAEPEKLRQAFSQQRWPVYGKLHGDFQSERLKNVASELREQDVGMRGCLIDACRGNGLAVVGYSGRDTSILEAFRSALGNGSFPGGLFWFKRFQDVLYPPVADLVKQARAVGIDAYIVEVETFDELFGDLLRFLPETEREIGGIAGSTLPRLAKIAIRASHANIPAIRTNALPIVSTPAICRLVVCEIGGSGEVQAAIEKSGLDVIAMRAKSGVLAFGRDPDIRATFQEFGITAFETHAISPSQFAAPTGTRALLREALFHAVSRRTGLLPLKRGTRKYLVPNTALVKPSDFNNNDSKPMDRLSGTIGSVSWAEACALRLDYKLSGLWLLLEPRILLDINDETPPSDAEKAREFARERRARRRNRESNAVLDGWVRLIVVDDVSTRMRTFDIADGHDAEFEVSRITAFSGVAK
jgi:hypothetical protein